MKKIALLFLLLSVGHLLVGQIISPCGHQHLLESRGSQFQQSTDQVYENVLRHLPKSSCHICTCSCTNIPYTYSGGISSISGLINNSWFVPLSSASFWHSSTEKEQQILRLGSFC